MRLNQPKRLKFGRILWDSDIEHKNKTHTHLMVDLSDLFAIYKLKQLALPAQVRPCQLLGKLLTSGVQFEGADLQFR
jgi:hypothetical protein